MAVLQQSGPAAADPTPLTWRLSSVAKALGISRRVLERERAAGRFPPPDRVVGRMPLWWPETVRAWLAAG